MQICVRMKNKRITRSFARFCDSMKNDAAAFYICNTICTNKNIATRLARLLYIAKKVNCAVKVAIISLGSTLMIVSFAQVMALVKD